MGVRVEQDESEVQLAYERLTSAGNTESLGAHPVNDRDILDVADDRRGVIWSVLAGDSTSPASLFRFDPNTATVASVDLPPGRRWSLATGNDEFTLVAGEGVVLALDDSLQRTWTAEFEPSSVTLAAAASLAEARVLTATPAGSDLSVRRYGRDGSLLSAISLDLPSLRDTQRDAVSIEISSRGESLVLTWEAQDRMRPGEIGPHPGRVRVAGFRENGEPLWSRIFEPPPTYAATIIPCGLELAPDGSIIVSVRVSHNGALPATVDIHRLAD